MPYWGPRRGWGWSGPRPVIVEEEPGGGFLGGLLGGLVGGAVGGAVAAKKEAAPPPPKSVSDDAAFTSAMKLISDVPEHGMVVLKPAEWRSLEDRKMITYVGSKAFVLNRNITTE